MKHRLTVWKKLVPKKDNEVFEFTFALVVLVLSSNDDCWNEITLEEIRNCINVFKKCLRLICKNNGGPIDHIV